MDMYIYLKLAALKLVFCRKMGDFSNMVGTLPPEINSLSGLTLLSPYKP